jgi:N6-L-threonylcarbamoyladenine synthase
MICLAIETSCDDTSVSVLEFQDSSTFEEIVSYTRVIASVTSSQISTHAQYGGVIPELGARLHTTNFQPVMLQAINIAILDLGITLEEFWSTLDLVAVTSEPGLNSALKVGLEQAKALRYYLVNNYDNQVAVVKVNHLKGHIASSFLENGVVESSPFPHLHLLVSGGNTQILKLDSWHKSSIVGKTVDDAVGECYDKTSRMLGFKYPGGVGLAKTAGLENHNYIKLNKAMINESLNTSFSGLKTQVRYITQALEIEGYVYEQYLSPEEILTLQDPSTPLLNPKLKFIKQACISIQSICNEQLVRKIKSAIIKHEPISLGLSGGVSANLLLRQELSTLGFTLKKPHLKYTGDNAAMIGLAGILDYLLKIKN